MSNEVRESAGVGSEWVPPERNPTFLQRLAALYYVSTFSGALTIWMITLYLCVKFSWVSLLVIPYTLWACLPAGATAAEQGLSPTPWKRWQLWRLLAGYFNARTIKTADLDASKPHIFCFHPHGIYSFSAWLTFATTATGFDKLYPKLDVRVLTLEINLRTPLFREYLLRHGICDVSRRAVLGLLSHGKSVLIAIGGGAESLLSRPGSNDLILHRRKGFVRMALRSGASLVPVWAFGETNTYSTLAGLGSKSVFQRVQATMLKAWGWTIPVYWGRGLFLPVGLLPYPVQLTTVIGEPIQVPKYHGDLDSAEFHALVDKYHKQYVDALTALFRQHKDKFAKGEDDLRIVE